MEETKIKLSITLRSQKINLTEGQAEQNDKQASSPHLDQGQAEQNDRQADAPDQDRGQAEQDDSQADVPHQDQCQHEGQAEQWKQPSPTSSLNCGTPKLIQPLTITRAVARCVSVQPNEISAQIITSIKLGTQQKDGGQAELQSMPGVDQAEKPDQSKHRAELHQCQGQQGRQLQQEGDKGQAEQSEQPSPSSSLNCGNLQTIQSLTITRAVARCVSVQSNEISKQILTSIKPGTQRTDRGQAEPQSMPEEDQAEKPEQGEHRAEQTGHEEAPPPAPMQSSSAKATMMPSQPYQKAKLNK